MIGIICDSGTDVPRDFFKNENIIEVPLNVKIKDESFQDWKTVPVWRSAGYFRRSLCSDR